MHPLMPVDSDSKAQKTEALEKTKKWLESMHGIVIGPGLGREEYLGWFLNGVVQELEEKKIVIIDADGLWVLMNCESFLTEVGKRKGVFLTPNIGEFDRLWKKIIGVSHER